jgi:hypothetical protein
MRKRLLCAVLWIAVFSQTKAGINDTVRVANFGVNPDDFTDVTSRVQKAIELCRIRPGVILWFEEGRYDFWPAEAVKKIFYESNTSSEDELADKTKTFGLYFEHIHDIKIEGNGATFMFHGKMTPWAFVECKNIKMQHINIDFERPSMSEMTFKTVSDSSITATIYPDSKYSIIHDRLVWYGEGWGMNNFHAILTDPRTGINTYSSWDSFLNSPAEQIDDRTVKFSGRFTGNLFKPGDVLTIRDPIRDQTGGFINLSSNISLSNINIYYMHGLGILAQFSKDLYYDHINIKPGPDSKRTMSGFADAMHFSSCKGQIKIENCQFKGLHDDPINVHGTHLKITEILSDSTLRIRFMHPQTYGFKSFFSNDSIAFVHPETLQVFARGLIKNSTLTSAYEMIIELSQPVPTGMLKGDCLENLSWNPSLTVSHCRFESVNTRGLLVTTRGKVLIEENSFYRTGMHAILISDDAMSWYESGPVEDVTIRGNEFIECAYNSAPDNYAISITPENQTLVRNYYVHHNVRIENNIFKVYDAPLMTARSVDGLIFKNNRIIQTHLMERGVNKPGFKIVACRNVQITSNVFNTDWKPVIETVETKKTSK